jgi:hypothetical protein
LLQRASLCVTFNPHVCPLSLAPAAGHNGRRGEVLLKHHRGRLRLRAYILIALVIVLAAVTLLIAAMLFAPR